MFPHFFYVTFWHTFNAHLKYNFIIYFLNFFALNKNLIYEFLLKKKVLKKDYKTILYDNLKMRANSEHKQPEY